MPPSSAAVTCPTPPSRTFGSHGQYSHFHAPMFVCMQNHGWNTQGRMKTTSTPSAHLGVLINRGDKVVLVDEVGHCPIPEPSEGAI